MQAPTRTRLPATVKAPTLVRGQHGFGTAWMRGQWAGVIHILDALCAGMQGFWEQLLPKNLLYDPHAISALVPGCIMWKRSGIKMGLSSQQVMQSLA